MAGRRKSEKASRVLSWCWTALGQRRISCYWSLLLLDGRLASGEENGGRKAKRKRKARRKTSLIHCATCGTPIWKADGDGVLFRAALSGSIVVTSHRLTLYVPGDKRRRRIRPGGNAQRQRVRLLDGVLPSLRFALSLDRCRAAGLLAGCVRWLALLRHQTLARRNAWRRGKTRHLCIAHTSARHPRISTLPALQTRKTAESEQQLGMRM